MAVVTAAAAVRTAVAAMILCGAAAAAAQDDVGTSTAAPTATADRGVDEFLTSLTQMIGSALNSDARYSHLLGGDAVGLPPQQDSVSGRPNRPSDHFDTGRPPYLANGPPYPPSDRPPYPPSDRPGFLPVRPPYPYRPPGAGPYGPGGYPQQNSVFQALSSISQHDDLRCVPRLLCEVSSGTRPSSGYYQPGYYQQQQQQSSIPFLSKDALITLLTVLNFVDDSPLLLFGRAALLGYNARGDPRSCTTAYPTCPRDPDQLINYLNNHNGGFFRFFSQQLPQYAPQYAAHQRPPYPPQPLYPPQRPPPYQQYNPQPPYQQRPDYQQPPYQQRPDYQLPPYLQRPDYPQLPGQHHQQQYAPQYAQRPRPRPPAQQFYSSRADFYNSSSGVTAAGQAAQRPRILSGTASQYYDVPAVQDLPLDVPGSGSRPSAAFPTSGMRFPSDDEAHWPLTADASDDHSGAADSMAPFAFPADDRRQAKRVKMTFPDRTGTGGLRADLDAYGNYKGVYYADGAIKFVDDDGGGSDDQRDRENRIRRPPSKIRLPYDRLAYHDRRAGKFKFPKTEA